MLQSVGNVLLPAALDRLVLLVNHVLSSEPLAMQRLVGHAGRRVHIDVDDWPALAPALPPLAFQVSPAGLFERIVAPADGTQVADLRLRVAVPNPALMILRVATGERPEMSVQGDAQFAADVQWLADNLRWDLEADLARVLGPVAARQLVSMGASLKAGLRAMRRAPQ